MKNTSISSTVLAVTFFFVCPFGGCIALCAGETCMLASEFGIFWKRRNILFFLASIVLPLVPCMEEKHKWRRWRWTIFICMFASTMFHNICKKTMPFAITGMRKDLGFEMTDLGTLGSSFALSFSIAKVFGGMAADLYSARFLLCSSLLTAGLMNVCFGLTSHLFIFSLLWAVNGACQGMAWPPVARTLTRWYPKNERASWWSLISTATTIVQHGLTQLAGASIAIGGSFLTQYYGWRYTMIVPGAVTIAVSFILRLVIRDSPQEAGLSSVEASKLQSPIKKVQSEDERSSVREILFKYVLSDPNIYLLSGISFLHCLVKMVIGDWGVIILEEMKGLDGLSGGGCMFWYEVAGVAGGLLAAVFSDRYFNGNRAIVIFIFMVCTSLSIAIFNWSETQNYFANVVMIFTIGFCMHGPQTLLGVAAAEIVNPKATGGLGTALGIVGSASGMGAFLAGYPFSSFTQQYGWKHALLLLACCAAVASVLLIPLLRDNKKKLL